VNRILVAPAVSAAGASLLIFATTFPAVGAEPAFAPYASVKPILAAQHDRLPADLKNTDESKWLAWSRREDKAIRSRLAQGDLDSMVNLLLYGTSFTKQPRIRMEALAEASKSGLLRARADDLVAGIRNPAGNERLVFVQHLLRNQGIDPDSPEAGAFLYSNLRRVIKERTELAERARKAAPASLLDRSSLFDDRGVSLDTAILPDFSIEQTLRDLKQRGVLREGQVTRVAVIGPGLDFADKNEASAYDYYPQQTVQPFAILDSLLRLGLEKPNEIALSVLDISPRVIEHVEQARERARKNRGYVIQLPRDLARPWPPDLVAYWRSFGDQIGSPVAPIHPPEIFPGLETRAVEVRPDVVLVCEPLDLDIVLERLDGAFDLIVATNIFVYYDPFEQSLALENAGAMLKPGGLLITNDSLPVIPGGSMHLGGVIKTTLDAVGWYVRSRDREGAVNSPPVR
jgi:SAM-dependent methyltransferase